jgi:hypothetical protein
MSNRIGGGNNNTGTTDNEVSQIIDFGEARAQRLDEKRRKTERIFFKNLLSVYCVSAGDKMRQMELIEISEEGCSFQIPFDSANPWPRNITQFPVRMYFSQDTYIQIDITIRNSSPYIDNGVRYTRYGCSVDTTTPTYAAFAQFVKFLKTYSELARKDAGDVSLFYL